MKKLYMYFFLILLFYIVLSHNVCLSYAQNNMTYKLESFDSLVQIKVIEKPKTGILFTCKSRDTLYIMQYFSLFNKMEMIPIAILNEGSINKSFYLGGEVEYIRNRTALMQSTLKSIYMSHCDTIYEIEQKLVKSQPHYTKKNIIPNFLTRTLYYSSTRGIYDVFHETVNKEYLNDLCWFYKEGDFYNIYEINRDCD